MHENKLYIIEGTVPAGYPEPGLFQQSLGWLDENGVGLRYQSVLLERIPTARPREPRRSRARSRTNRRSRREHRSKEVRMRSPFGVSIAVVCAAPVFGAGLVAPLPWQLRRHVHGYRRRGQGSAPACSAFLWIYLEVKDPKGERADVGAGSNRPTGLQRIGVTPDYVKLGDAVKARCHHLRDGSNGCLLGFLKAKDGTVKDWDGNNAPPPSDF